jgi:signal transduction histidine kinase
MIEGAINNVLNNPFRYTKEKIKIKALNDENKYLVIQIADDGAGYPEQMLNNVPDTPMKNSFFDGGIGLGLYFAYSVVRIHKNKGRSGYITISNLLDQGGGCFRIFLP